MNGNNIARGRRRTPCLKQYPTQRSTKGTVSGRCDFLSRAKILFIAHAHEIHSAIEEPAHMVEKSDDLKQLERPVEDRLLIYVIPELLFRGQNRQNELAQRDALHGAAFADLRVKRSISLSEALSIHWPRLL